MRLGQLSRKINKKPTEILSYLKNEFDIELGSHLNTKVPDELTQKVVKKFEIAVVIETPIATPPVEEEEVIASTPIDHLIVIEDLIVEVEVPEAVLETVVKEFEPQQEVDATTILNATLIKAPKVELPGPKVVGKIELPLSLEEQMIEVDGVMMSKADLANRKKEERKERLERRQQSKPRSSKDVRISRKKSEAQIAQIVRDKELEDMSNRLAHREKRIVAKQKSVQKPKNNFVANKPKKKTVAPIIEKQQVVAPKPSTWHGKLWYWFNH